MTKRKLISAGLLACLTVLAWGQTLQGAEEVPVWVYPSAFGEGSSVVGTVPVQADAFNPAASGNNQRTTFDLSYSGLIGELGYGGHLMNLGLSLPTSLAVLNVSAQILTASLQEAPLGTVLRLNAGISKDVFDSLLLGAGLKFGAGAYPGQRLMGEASLDLGMVHIPGDVGPLKDLRWGLSFRGLGWSFGPAGVNQPFPQSFTPALGARSALIREPGFVWSVHTDWSFPSFQNVVSTLGTQVQLFDNLNLHLGWSLDWSQAANSQVRTWLPSFGLSYNLLTDLGEGGAGLVSERYRRNEMLLQTGVRALGPSAFAYTAGLNLPLGVVDLRPPTIEISYPDNFHFSPNNDGRQDVFVLPFRLIDDRYVMSYRWEISDSSGAVVRTIRNKDPHPDTADWATFWRRLVSPKAGIPIPETLEWDGALDTGALAPDGRYSFTVFAADDNGNEGKVGPYEIVLDNTPPVVRIDPLLGSDLVFSPDGDRSKDEITIRMTGEIEDLWTVEITDSFGKVLLSRDFTYQAPRDFTWDGRDQDGTLVPDGVYNFRVRSTDLAGNSLSSGVENILVNTMITPVVLELAAGEFSPNGDGVQDTVDFIPNIPVAEGVRGFTLEVLNEQNQVVRRVNDSSGRLPPMRWTFDGRNDRGQILPEGLYRARLVIDYLKGNRPEALSPPVRIDLTPPQVSVVIEGPAAFSPDGDGNRDELPLRQSGSEEVTWTGAVFRSSDTNLASPLRTFTWSGTPESSVAWNGQNDAGQLLPDGTYLYVLRSTDRAGNSAQARTSPFTLDTRAREVVLTVEHRAFSPNGDGRKDQNRFFPRSNVADNVAEYSLILLNEAGQTVRTFSGQRTLPAEVVWDGALQTGGRAPDGTYRSRLTVTYVNGSRAQADSAAFVIDTQAPEVTLNAPFTVFSPNGDGKKDLLTINQTVNAIAQWTGTLRNREGQTVRTFNWRDRPSDLVWDGKDTNGNPAPDGVYEYELIGEEDAGNRVRVTLGNLTVDNRPTSVFVTLDKTAFSPGKTGGLGEVRFNLVAGLNEGIESWRLTLLHSTQGVQREYGGTGTLPASLVWDGRTAPNSPALAPEGSYLAQIRVVYVKGDEVSAASPSFLLDLSPPEATVRTTPELFGPDNDGVNDELRFQISVRDPSGIESWALQIRDPEGNAFTRFEGQGQPAAEIAWDGRSRTGELVQAASDYSWTFTVRDRLGNQRELSGVVAVDILVIRDGDRLKIQVPSITFGANSPSILADSTEPAEINRRVLRRIAEVLNRFNTYRVQIEGHAVLINWNNPARAAQEEAEELAPLSLGRANSVRDSLVALGVARTRLSTVGRGGTEPVVPHGDTVNRWKNRRVEFILLR